MTVSLYNGLISSKPSIIIITLKFCSWSQPCLNNSISKPGLIFSSSFDTKSIAFPLSICFCCSVCSASVWSFKSILMTHFAGNFCLIWLERCVSTVVLPIPAVSEINITLWLCACSNSLTKSSAVYVCELSVSTYSRSFSKLPCDCCQKSFPDSSCSSQCTLPFGFSSQHCSNSCSVLAR